MGTNRQSKKTYFLLSVFEPLRSGHFYKTLVVSEMMYCTVLYFKMVAYMYMYFTGKLIKQLYSCS